MQRPTGVIFIAAVYFVSAIVGLLGGVAAFFVGGAFMMRAASMGMTLGRGIAGGLGAAVGVLLLVFGVLFLVIGIGLIGMKGWARVVAMVLSAIFAVFGLLHMLPLMAHFEMFRLGFTLIRVALNILVVWYLNQATVKQAFGA